MSENETAAVDIDALPRIYRAGNDVIGDAYRLGIEAGRRLGRDEDARDHHRWLLSHDERLAQVDREARREALLDAAEAWETGTDLDTLADKHYRAGGPSMPTIWLRLRAGEPADVATAALTAAATQPAGGANEEKLK